eukprot:1047212-Amphidinium_carterae.1
MRRALDSPNLPPNQLLSPQQIRHCELALKPGPFILTNSVPELPDNIDFAANCDSVNRSCRHKDIILLRSVFDKKSFGPAVVIPSNLPRCNITVGWQPSGQCKIPKTSNGESRKKPSQRVCHIAAICYESKVGGTNFPIKRTKEKPHCATKVIDPGAQCSSSSALVIAGRFVEDLEDPHWRAGAEQSSHQWGAARLHSSILLSLSQATMHSFLRFKIIIRDN